MVRPTTEESGELFFSTSTRTCVAHSNTPSRSQARSASRFAWLAFLGSCGSLSDSLTEGRHWIKRALQADNTPSHERAWALATCGYIAILQGDTEAQAALLGEAYRLAVELDDDAACAYATHLLGMQGNFTGDVAAGIPLFIEALERYAAVDVPRTTQFGSCSTGDHVPAAGRSWTRAPPGRRTRSAVRGSRRTLAPLAYPKYVPRLPRVTEWPTNGSRDTAA